MARVMCMDVMGAIPGQGFGGGGAGVALCVRSYFVNTFDDLFYEKWTIKSLKILKPLT